MLQWSAMALSSKRLLHNHNMLTTMVRKRNLSAAVTRLFKNSVVAACRANELRASAAAAAVKSHAAATVKAIMDQMEGVHVELDEYRRDALAAMALQATEALESHQQQLQRQQQQQQFVSSMSTTDSWNATADFLRLKLGDIKVCNSSAQTIVVYAIDFKQDDGLSSPF